MKNNNYNPNRIFAVLVSVFFFWGFITASNVILIPVFKKRLSLSQFNSQLIEFAFYIGYTIGSLIYLGIIKFFKLDLVKDLGYGKSIATGLFVSAAGTLLFIPAANSVSFPLLLIGLIIVAIGFSFQQTAANPLAIMLGSASTGSQRLSRAGGINNLGTTIGPLIVSFAIFGKLGQEASKVDITAVKLPYMALGVLFVLFGVIFWRLKVENSTEDDTEIQDDSQPARSALSYPQLWMGMIAIFLYVGVEVATAANLPEYMKLEMGIETKNIAPYISLFWASLMIGRWTSAASAFNISEGIKKALRFILPFVAFSIFLGVNWIAGNDVSIFYTYAAMIAVLIVLDIASNGNPAIQLAIYSGAGIIALITGIFTGGELGMFAIISVGLFCSTLWPCIFTIALAGLGKSTAQGSNLLIMMIMGGGVMSLTQGSFADIHHNEVAAYEERIDSLDIQSFKIAINKLQQESELDIYPIISEFNQLNSQQMAKELSKLLENSNISSGIWIGKIPESIKLESSWKHYNNPEQLMDSINLQTLKNKIVLIKGSKKYNVKQIVNRLEKEDKLNKLSWMAINNTEKKLAPFKSNITFEKDSDINESLKLKLTETADITSKMLPVQQKDIRNSYWVGVFCFLYLGSYALITKKNLKQQGIYIGKLENSGH